MSGTLAAGGRATPAGGAEAIATRAGAAAQVPAAVTPSVVHPYDCTTTFAGGASYVGRGLQVTVTDALHAPGVHSYPGGPVTAQVGVSIDAGPAAVTALLDTGTTDWTSTNATIAWGGQSSPPAAFAWQIIPVPQFSERFPITFTTASFDLPGPGDVAPGALGWDFQANAGVRPGFETGRTACVPVRPVQIYATFLPASGPSCAHDRAEWTCRFSYTGATQLWQVPADVRQVTVEVRGAGGGSFEPEIDIDKVFPGGRGGASYATLAVTPGEYLVVTVGGADGFNGGGNFTSSSPGGGGSDVRRRPYGLAERLVVAGGGGGGGMDVFCFTGCPDGTGGAGGGAAGVGSGGGPGTQDGGGAAQTTDDPCCPATPGSSGTGGDGSTGGGGGYFGGGGGAGRDGIAEIGGGGGGSGFVPAGPENSTVVGLNSGDGSVSIRYTSATTPYTSRYTADEAGWLFTVLRALHSRDVAAAQHDAAMFMVLVGVVLRAIGVSPPNLGSAPGTGPIAVTSTYTRAENARLLRAAEFFRSDPPTVQRTGIAFLAAAL